MAESQGAPGPWTTGDDEPVRVIMNLPRSVLKKVERLAAAHELSRTTVIRRAIDLDDFFDRIAGRGGTILVKERGCDELKEVIFR